MSQEAPGVFQRIVTLLDAGKMSYRAVEHAPARTSEESARARGVPLGCGAKALLLKCDGVFRLFVMAADRKLHLPFPLYADVALGSEFPEVAFNAGELTRRIIMPASDWAAIAGPQRFEFALPLSRSGVAGRRPCLPIRSLIQPAKVSSNLQSRRAGTLSLNSHRSTIRLAWHPN